MTTDNATVDAVAIVTTIPGSISLLKLLDLCFLCGVATYVEILAIWTEVHYLSSNQAGFALLIKNLMSGMGICYW